jgi:hypothetical protein
MRLSSLHEIGSKTVRRCPMPQSVLARDKRREIERKCVAHAQHSPPLRTPHVADYPLGRTT